MNKRKSGCWEWLLDQHSPDYVMAQEASPLPEGIDATVRTTTKKSNRTVFYSKNQNHGKIREITSPENLAEYQIILERETTECEMEKFKIPLPGYDPRITHTNAGRLAFYAYGEAFRQREEFFSSCMKSKGYLHFTNERLLSLYPKEAGKLGITY